MSLNPIRLRRSIANIGATPEQVDEFTEALAEGFADVATKQDLEALEHRIVNRLLIAMLGMAAMLIAAMGVLTRV